MENEAVKFMKGNEVNLKFNGNNMGKVSGLVLCLRVMLHVSHAFRCSKMSSHCAGTLMRGKK